MEHAVKSLLVTVPSSGSFEWELYKEGSVYISSDKSLILVTTFIDSNPVFLRIFTLLKSFDTNFDDRLSFENASEESIKIVNHCLNDLNGLLCNNL